MYLLFIGLGGPSRHSIILSSYLYICRIFIGGDAHIGHIALSSQHLMTLLRSLPHKVLIIQVFSRPKSLAQFHYGPSAKWADPKQAYNLYAPSVRG